MLHRVGVRWITNVEVARIEEGKVVLRNHITGAAEGHEAACAVWIGKQHPCDGLRDAIRAEGVR